jgi:hypothetical protein
VICIKCLGCKKNWEVEWKSHDALSFRYSLIY